MTHSCQTLSTLENYYTLQVNESHNISLFPILLDLFL